MTSGPQFKGRSRTIAHSVNLGLQGGIFLRQLIGTRFLFLVGNP
jgi:hypothetical protein